MLIPAVMASDEQTLVSEGFGDQEAVYVFEWSDTQTGEGMFLTSSISAEVEVEAPSRGVGAQPAYVSTIYYDFFILGNDRQIAKEGIEMKLLAVRKVETDSNLQIVTYFDHEIHGRMEIMKNVIYELPLLEAEEGLFPADMISIVRKVPDPSLGAWTFGFEFESEAQPLVTSTKLFSVQKFSKLIVVSPVVALIIAVVILLWQLNKKEKKKYEKKKEEG